MNCAEKVLEPTIFVKLYTKSSFGKGKVIIVNSSLSK